MRVNENMTQFLPLQNHKVTQNFKNNENYSELPSVSFTMTHLSNSDPSILLSLQWSSILLVMKINVSVFFSG